MGNLATDKGPTIEFLLMAQGTKINETALRMQFPQSHKWLTDPNVLVADTGATIHLTAHRIGMTNTKPANNKAVTMGNGANGAAAAIGKVPGMMCDKEGAQLGQATIQATYLPDGKFNLFSCTKLQKEGWELHGDSDAIWLTKGDKKILFDIKVPTDEGLMFTMYHEREVAATATNVNKEEQPFTCSIAKAHDLLGHRNETEIRETAKYLGWKITRGSLGVCESCTEAKAKQKNLPRHPQEPPSTRNNNRMYLDISTIRKTKDGLQVSKGNWRIDTNEVVGLL